MKFYSKIKFIIAFINNIIIFKTIKKNYFN